MLTVTRLTSDDLEFLRSLRNLYRTNFFNSDWISPERQQEWFASLDEDHRYYVIWSDAERVGAFSIVPLNHRLPIPWSPKPTLYLNALMISPEHRGKSYIQATHQVLNHDYSYVGYVKASNESSLIACLKLGFTDLGVFDVPDYGWMHVLLME